MRNLNQVELEVVSGGNQSINKRVADACNGQPDSTTVTITNTTKGTLENPLIGGTSAGTSTTTTTNCGDFREQEEERKKAQENDPNAAS